MQNRIRTHRCSQVDGKPRKSQIARICCGKIAFFLFLFTLSCAQLKSVERDYSQTRFENSFKKIALTGSGKGRGQFFSERYSFSYEALLESNLHYWGLGLSAPLLGEEVFKIFYNDKVHVVGSFYDRLKAEAEKSKQEKYYLEILDQYLLGFGNFLQIYEAQKRGEFQCEKGECIFPKLSKKLSWYYEGGNFVLSLDLDAETSFVLESFDEENTCFKRSRIFLKEKKNFGPRTRSLEIELAVSSCEG